MIASNITQCFFRDMERVQIPAGELVFVGAGTELRILNCRKSDRGIECLAQAFLSSTPGDVAFAWLPAEYVSPRVGVEGE
jgi:hypothetical protein